MINRVKVTTHLLTPAMYDIIKHCIWSQLPTLCIIHPWLQVFLRFFNIYIFIPTGKSWRSTLSSTESLHLPRISLFRPDRFGRPGHLKNDFLIKEIPTFYVPKIPVNDYCSCQNRGRIKRCDQMKIPSQIYHLLYAEKCCICDCQWQQKYNNYETSSSCSCINTTFRLTILQLVFILSRMYAWNQWLCS